MKYSVLDMTQNILSSLDSDEVNSISDTAEARQVSQIIRTAYFNIVSRADLPEHKQLYQLVASGDNDFPVQMTKPAAARTLEWLKYNKKELIGDPDNYQYITILPVQQFLDYVHSFNTDDDEVGTFEFNSNTFYYKDDTTPTYCTIINDHYIIFDSYDVALETTLQSDKTMAYGLIAPSFELDDDFIPDLDDQQFVLLLNEAKSLAFFELKQIPHQKAEQESRRQWVSLQRTKALNKPSAFDLLPNYGRK